MIIIRADRAKAKAVNTELLTSGMVGPQVKFVFSNEWNGLNKTAVFRAGDVTIDVLDSQWNGNICTIPNECLATSGNTITVGIYGCNNDGDLIIPTVYARVGTVRVGANPYGDDNANPSLPVYEQIRSSIGKLSDLDTVDKSNLVAAINEAAKTADNIVTYTEQSLTDEQKAQVRENIGAVDIADLPTVYPHPITRIESLDKTNLIALRNLDSGTYVLYGYFKPFDGSTSTMTFGSNILVSIVKKTSESHVQIFYPNNNCVQYVKITDTSYERKNVYLNDLLSAVRFDEAQELTETQQEQARKNINAAEDGVQSDWLQNDPAAADYIKNRICYDESSTEEIEYVDTICESSGTHDLNMPLILGEKIRYEFYSTSGAISYAGSGIVTTDDNGTLMAIFTVPGDITEDTDNAVIKLYADHYVYAAGFYENAVNGFSKMVFIRSVPSTKIKTIDPKYLPVVGGYDIKASTTVTFEKSGEWYSLGRYGGASIGLEKFPVDSAPLNGRLPTKEELATAKNFGGNIQAPWSGDLQIIDIGDDNFALSPYTDPSHPTDLPVLMVVNSSVTINNVVIESGLYGGRLALSSDIILDVTSFEMDVQIIEPKKIPAEYLDAEYEYIKNIPGGYIESSLESVTITLGYDWDGKIDTVGTVDYGLCSGKFEYHELPTKEDLRTATKIYTHKYERLDNGLTVYSSVETDTKFYVQDYNDFIYYLSTKSSDSSLKDACLVVVLRSTKINNAPIGKGVYLLNTYDNSTKMGTVYDSVTIDYKKNTCVKIPSEFVESDFFIIKVESGEDEFSIHSDTSASEIYDAVQNGKYPLIVTLGIMFLPSMINITQSVFTYTDEENGIKFIITFDNYGAKFSFEEYSPTPIPKITSLDESNIKTLRSLKNGVCLLDGYFAPYTGSDSTLIFDPPTLASINSTESVTHVQIFEAYNNQIQHLVITDTSCETTSVLLNDLNDTVLYTEQALTNEEKSQALINIGAVPNICVDRGTIIGTFKNIDNKNAIVEDLIIACGIYYTIKPTSGTTEYSISFSEDTDGTLTYDISSNLTKNGYTVAITSSKKVFLNTWLVSIKVTGTSSTISGYTVTPYTDIRFPIDTITNGNQIPVAVEYSDDSVPSNARKIFKITGKEPSGFVYNEIVTAYNQTEARDYIYSGSKAVYCKYDNPPFDWFFIGASSIVGGSYYRYSGYALKDGIIGTAELMINSSNSSYWSFTFTQTSYSPLIVHITASEDSGTSTSTSTSTSTDSVTTYTADKTYDEIIAAAEKGPVYAEFEGQIYYQPYTLENGATIEFNSPVFYDTSSYSGNVVCSNTITITTDNTIEVWFGSSDQYPVTVDTSVETLMEGMTPIVSSDLDGNLGWVATFPPSVRIVSSTSGSNKVFDITVDDTGTIKATEVTL